ncbi:uncharacterized protein K02A2.6-like [Culex pipiens pallens]|uniref:uncharacterized protein K02A2.6-like n=1 Tax=Culex pipiens pallens TaxID=42434 RepID=UPI001954EC9D|nr:uncharacterized protein K02A2.6-like [Culex pipiens pallens]XP_039448165.1 uncharacterized protein K02A2.6-like [Culex pipiens pallens]XP_052562142.1 uncharacterized protein K02A2.6-like [Culex pipiens pallens]
MYALQLLHANHRGIQKMKQLSRQFVYWEGIGVDIEVFANSCKICQLKGIDRTPQIYGNWPLASTTFERVHIDFFQKYNRTFLILVDAHSRWVEIIRMNKTKAEEVAQELDTIFATFGFPGSMVSDNGPPFSSQKFSSFCKINNNIRTFLHHHHQTPTTGDRIIPNERVFNFIPRSELINLREKKTVFCTNYENENTRKFKKNDKVIYTYKMNGKKFTHEAVIIKPMSELIFLIQIQGNIRKAHVNQLNRIPQVPFTLKIRPDNSTPIHPNNTSPTLSTNSSDEEDNTKDSSADVEANNKESSSEESLSSADEETEP